jgi:hypothetical protein
MKYTAYELKHEHDAATEATRPHHETWIPVRPNGPGGLWEL